MLKKMYLSFLILFAGMFSLQMVPPSVHAQLFKDAKQAACSGAQLEANAGCSQTQADKADTIVKRIVTILSIIVGIIAVIMIIINGLRFITSNGDSNTISSARNGIIYALVGLIIVALAQFIVRYVITNAS